MLQHARAGLFRSLRASGRAPLSAAASGVTAATEKRPPRLPNPMHPAPSPPPPPPASPPPESLDDLDVEEPEKPWHLPHPKTGEVGGPKGAYTGAEPTRYGDWEKGGRVSDF
eukprot:tig00000498_g1657.t1